MRVPPNVLAACVFALSVTTTTSKQNDAFGNQPEKVTFPQPPTQTPPLSPPQLPPRPSLKTPDPPSSQTLNEPLQDSPPQSTTQSPSQLPTQSPTQRPTQLITESQPKLKCLPLIGLTTQPPNRMPPDSSQPSHQMALQSTTQLAAPTFPQFSDSLPETPTQSPSQSPSQSTSQSSPRSPSESPPQLPTKPSTETLPDSLPQSQTPPSIQSPPQLATQTTPRQPPQSPPEPLPQAPDSGIACSCSNSSNSTQLKLDCSSRGRSTIHPEDLCDGPTIRVNLYNNSFVALPANWSTDILVVNVSRNRLNAIPRAPPLNPKTHTLDVSYNHIEYSSDELEPLFFMRKLIVSGNRLQSLRFLPSPCSLSIILADHNRLRSLEGPLSLCFMLLELDVSWNQLGVLPENAFFNHPYLLRLKMVHAGITSIAPGAFANLRTLKCLDLSENKLTTLSSGAFMSIYLENLILEKNEISSLPADVFSRLRFVEKISLAKNKLRDIPKELFWDLYLLKHLNLSENELRYLPEDLFAGLPYLTEIDLQLNFLEKLHPEVFSGLQSLKRINLAGNSLATVPVELLAGLSSLELLDLSSNQLTSVPSGLFRGVKSIEVLDFSFNRLTTLTGSQLEGLDNVEWLYLKGNQFTQMPVYNTAWPQVTHTNLEENRITELNEGAVRGWLGDGSQARRVSLGNRQWLRSVASLRWAVEEREVATEVDAVDCKCGVVRRGNASVFFCASVSCPGDVAHWVEEAAQG